MNRQQLFSASTKKSKLVSRLEVPAPLGDGIITVDMVNPLQGVGAAKSSLLLPWKVRPGFPFSAALNSSRTQVRRLSALNATRLWQPHLLFANQSACKMTFWRRC